MSCPWIERNVIRLAEDPNHAFSRMFSFKKAAVSPVGKAPSAVERKADHDVGFGQCLDKTLQKISNSRGTGESGKRFCLPTCMLFSANCRNLVLRSAFS